MHLVLSRAPRLTRVVGIVTTAALTAALISLTPTAQGAPRPKPADTPAARVHWENGKALTGTSSQAPGQVVKAYLERTGSSKATADSLATTGPAWTTRGVTHVRMTQSVAGLRVYNSEAKASLDKNGRLIDLVENVVKASAPLAATTSSDDALRTAVASLYPGRKVSTSGSSKVGNTTTYARQGFSSAPTVEQVAIPTQGGGLEVAYAVTTWTADTNQLNETLVSGDGVVVSNELRSADDAYNVFPEDPDKTSQTLVTNPADATASPLGWLTGSQLSRNISGNNAHAYLDIDNNDQADPGGAPVTNGVFGAIFDPTTQPSAGANTEVAVQNLFYLNNLIHDTLYRAGFTEAAGNFQQDNLGRGGKDSDPVQAEAQDGGGTDNANFATPTDGQDPRMQMYLWVPFGTFEVVVHTPAAIAGSYQASGAAFGGTLDPTGVTADVVLANDGTGTTSDACENLTGVPAGALVLADRGTCTFVTKASNAQSAGASGLIVANNVDTQPFTMGGADPTITIPAVMISQADGATLKTGIAAGENATIHVTDPPPPMHDGDLDSDIVWHEYGHGLTWRMIGRMSGPMSGAIGEGMSDVLAVIANDDPIVAEYSASDPAGLRTHSYEGYNRTYGDIVGTEVHDDGEVYGAIGWDLWKQYRDGGLGRSAVLADLVDGMNYTPPAPTFEQMRDGILAGLTATGHDDRACMVWNSFAEYGVGVGALGKAVGKKVVVTESFTKPASCP
jgi:extracellular elastinolytic metalloproteinase